MSVPDVGFWSARRVLVTGASGFLGGHLCRHLADLGATVVTVRRDEVGTPPPTVVTVRGDVTDGRLCERVLGDYEVQTVFHLAAQSQVQVANRNPVETFDSNVRGTWTLLDAVRRSPAVGQVVVASSDKAYGAQPSLPYTEQMPLAAVNPYDVSKACADLLARSYFEVFGVPVSVTRCGNLFGPGDRNWARLIPSTVRSLLGGEAPLIRSDGSPIRDYLYVTDAALGYLCLAEAMADDPAVIGEAFNLSAERPLSVLELVAMITTAMGVTDLPPVIEGRASHEIHEQHLSAAKARHLLGWQAAHTMEEALGETVAWYRDQLRGGGR